MANKKFNFEEKMAQLKEITEKLKNDNENIDNLLIDYEKGIKIANECQEYLQKVENKIIDISKSYSENEKLENNE